MKKLIHSIIALLILSATVFAQAPQSFNYQAVARDASGEVMANQQVSFQISILQGGESGTAIYTETHTDSTNQFGLVILEIGTGTTTSDFTGIDWGSDAYFIQVEMDASGGTSYTLMGTSQLLSVPYALHAKTAANKFSGDYSDLINKPEIPDTLYDLVLDAGNKSINNLSDPTNNQDAATKTYVDAMIEIMKNNGITVVDFSAYPTSSAIGAPIYFTDHSKINPTSWNWDFGDSTTSTVQNPDHSYANEDIYTVKLTASNGTLSFIATKSDYITVSTTGTVTDYDGNTYNTTLVIGNQEWIAENLKVIHYPDGTPIPLVTDSTTWANLEDNNTDDAYCYYNNNANSEADTYGALYTWAAAMGDNAVSSNANPSGVQGVCPDGWHLPSDAEWTELIDYLEANGHSGTEGTALKASSGWNNDGNGTNDYGFSALPGGTRYNHGAFFYEGEYGNWWSATEVENGNNNAWTHNMGYGYNYIQRTYKTKDFGLSIRCIKDY